MITKLSAQSTSATQSLDRIIQIEHHAKTSASNLEVLFRDGNSLTDRIVEMRDGSEEVAKTLVEHSLTYEEQIASAKKLAQTIEGLLPGATSAGLSSAFRERKNSFKLSIRLWASVFVASILICYWLLILIQFHSREQQLITKLCFHTLFQDFHLPFPLYG